MSLSFLTDFNVLGRRVAGALTVVILLFFCTSAAYAHKVHIFAYADGDEVKTESSFNGGRSARNCTVNVHDVSGGDVVATGKTDDQGHYNFSQPVRGGDLDIIISCGDGHRGSWRFEAEEYVAAGGEADSHVHPQPEQEAPKLDDSHEAVLRKIIAEEVENKVAPLRRELARLAERKTGLQDILGGIGYLFGLAGLAAYMKYKKNK